MARAEAPPDDAPAPRVAAPTLYALAIVLLIGGLAAALFAGYEVVNPAASQFCSPNPLLSCSKVLDSGHTTVVGVPDWLVGTLGYVAMLSVAVLAYRTYDRRYLHALTGLSALGLLLSLYFVYNELVVIGAICLVCSTAHLLNVGVLAVSLALVRLSRPERGAPSPPAARTGSPAPPP